MDTLTIRASNLRSFGESRGSTFCLVTGPDLVGRFRIEPGPRYADACIVPYTGDAAFEELLARDIPENAHVLVILPHHYFKSPPPEALGERRKLGVLACHSTPTSLEAIAHFLAMGEHTDPDRQEQMAGDFFSRGQAAERLRFVDERFGTVAEFEHLGDELLWHEQIGVLGWGQQQLFPPGEISVLPVQVFGQNIDSRLKFNGRLVFQGHPVLHSGTPSYLPADQERLFRKLTTLHEDALIATFEDGAIVAFEQTASACAPAAEVLQAMCEVDSRYRCLLEIGFGINTGMGLYHGNSAMNEVFGGRNGAVHFGLGLIPYTQYHLDLICPHTRVVGTRGEVVFAGATGDADA